MKKKSSREAIILGVFLCVLPLMCVSFKPTPSEQNAVNTIPDPATEQTESTQEASMQEASTQEASIQDVCMQMALYIQEGFCTYGIEGSYEAYFGPVKVYDDIYYSCEILLDGADGLWREALICTYDAKTDWYNFRGGDDAARLTRGQEEPILGGNDSLWASRGKMERDSSYNQDFMEKAIYKTTISQEIDLGCPVRYYGKTGPVEHDSRFHIHFFQEEDGMLPYSVDSYLYTYYDERMDIDINVLYPQIYYYGNLELTDAVNEALKHVCLYDTPLDTEVKWDPSYYLYSTETRNYMITRQDEKYLSMRVFTSSYTRDNARGSEHEYGITIDMETGMPVHLSDVVGEYQTMQALLDTGAFPPQWMWLDISEEEWMQRMSWWADPYETLDDYDHDFYLTDDGLGLIACLFSSSLASDHVCMEADWEALGLTPP